MEAMRESWTDERLDDLTRRVDAGFAQTHEDIAALRVDNKELRRDMAALDSDLRSEMTTLGSDLRSEMTTLGSDLRGEMAELGSDLRGEMSQLATRKELQTEIKAVRAEMRDGFSRVDALNKRFDDLNRTLIAATLAGIIALLANHFV